MTFAARRGDGAPVDGRFPGIVVEFSPYAVLRDFYLGEADFFTAAATPRSSPSSGGWADPAGGGSTAASASAVGMPTISSSGSPPSRSRTDASGCTARASVARRATARRSSGPSTWWRSRRLQSPSSLYHDVVFPGGIKATERGEIDNWPDIATLTSGGVIDADAEFAANRAHPTFDDFWRERSFVDCLDAVTIPILAIGGWNDMYFRSGTLANIEAQPERTWAVYGPWQHFFPVALVEDAWSGTDGTAAELLTELPQMRPGVLLAWFDHWVAGMPDVPVPAEPTFTSYEGPVGVGAGWCELEGWDAAGRVGAALYAGADGSLSAEPGVSGTVSFRQPDEPSDAVDAVTFTSAPLADDQVLLGRATFTFEAALDAGDAHFYAELFDVAPTGEEILVNDGHLAATHRASHADPEPVVVGEPAPYRVAIRPQHHRFRSGNRVRVRLSGGASSRLTAPPAPVTVTMETGDQAVLWLPGFSRDR